MIVEEIEEKSARTRLEDARAALALNARERLGVAAELHVLSEQAARAGEANAAEEVIRVAERMREVRAKQDALDQERLLLEGEIDIVSANVISEVVDVIQAMPDPQEPQGDILEAKRADYAERRRAIVERFIAPGKLEQQA